MKLFKLILGIILNLANRNIPLYYKQGFYALKQRLLFKYGSLCLVEFQHIIKHCYSCKKGIFYCSWKKPETCWSCHGTTIYDEFWVKLLKYKIGKYYFHLPVERYYDYTEFTKARKESIKKFKTNSKPIEGYINHKIPKFNLGTEAMLLLALFNNPFHFIKTIGHFRKSYAITPLLILNNLIFNIRWFSVYDIIESFKKPFRKINNCEDIYLYDELPF